MIEAYINYPNPHITIHSDSACGRIRPQQKTNQRVVRIDTATRGEELEKFANRQYRFAAQVGLNDMWLTISLSTEAEEKALVEQIRGLLATHYRPFVEMLIEEHC